MDVAEAIPYIMVFFGALLFGLLTLMDESDIEDPDVPTYMAMLIRRPVFAFFAFIFWVVWGAMCASLNNCDTQFGTGATNCFTTAGQTATTATIYVEQFAGVLSDLGYILAAVFFILFVFFVILNGYTIARNGFIGQRRGNKVPAA